MRKKFFSATNYMTDIEIPEGDSGGNPLEI